MQKTLKKCLAQWLDIQSYRFVDKLYDNAVLKNEQYGKSTVHHLCLPQISKE